MLSIKLNYIVDFLISFNLFQYINLPLNSYSSYEGGGGTAYENDVGTGETALVHPYAAMGMGCPLPCFIIGLDSDLSSSLEFNFPPTLNCLYMFSLKSLPNNLI